MNYEITKNYENIDLTDLWFNGEYEQVAEIIRDSKEFLEKDRLIDFCLYFDKYVGRRELQVLQKLI